MPTTFNGLIFAVRRNPAADGVGFYFAGRVKSGGCLKIGCNHFCNCEKSHFGNKNSAMLAFLYEQK